ncbi:hypothetical protein [Xenorhabdus indica]|uniref:hypothetical protein n=1 Tax=Xenorhabdus indica TaxID=333964 RepID=UPI001657356F|nr:hypothetical protein [Xenorhabdus indica]MBC8947058.1 hypothetical protein [Xenorhabdus indica]
MAGQITTVPNDKKNIIKGQPFSVVFTITGESNITDAVTVSIVSSPGLKLIKTFPGSVYKRVFSQQLIFLADESSKDHQISFTTNSPSKLKGEVTYHSIDNPEMIRDTCVLRGASAYLYDPSPVAFTGPAPTTNPFISASINPMMKKGGAISSYDIPLRATAPLRIFTAEDMKEIPAYEVDLEKQYYYYLVNKPSIDAVNLKIYATQSISRFVGIETIFSQIEYSQKETIFINTIKLNTSDSFEPPVIEETYSSSNLTRPDQTDNFHFMIPNYPGAKSGDFIIGFVTDDDKDIYKKQLCFGQLEREQSGYYKLSADYDNLYAGDNFISYVGLDEKGNTVGSKLNYISYDSGGNNTPDPNDTNRTLVAPEVYDQFGVFIGIYQAVNINSIGQKGLEVRLLSDSTKPDTTIAAGDMITIKAYISHSIDTLSPARPLPIVVIENHPVKPNEIIDGYYKVIIKPELLMGYGSSGGDDDSTIAIDYRRVAQNQKSKLYIRSFGTSFGTAEP